MSLDIISFFGKHIEIAFKTVFHFFLDGSKKSGTSDASSDIIEEDTAENGHGEPEMRYYDKSSSFFDRISCEALEKQEGYVHNAAYFFYFYLPFLFANGVS